MDAPQVVHHTIKVKHGHFCILQSFTLEDIFNLGKKEGVTWGNVWGVWGFMDVWNVVFN
jgi:hypothetical protein